MTDRPNEPLSSEDLIRRARTDFTDPAPAEDPPAPSTAPSPPADLDPRPHHEPVQDGPLITDDFQPSAGPVPQRRRRGRGTAWVARGLIALLVVGGALVFSVFNSSKDIDALDVGDCFADPGLFDVATVETIDCSEPHDMELFARSELAYGSVFPGDQTLFDTLMNTCFNHFETYVDHDYQTSAYDFTAFIPTRESWDQGDRTGLCALVGIDATFNPIVTTGSARNSGR